MSALSWKERYQISDRRRVRNSKDMFAYHHRIQNFGLILTGTQADFDSLLDFISKATRMEISRVERSNEPLGLKKLLAEMMGDA